MSASRYSGGPKKSGTGYGLPQSQQAATRRGDLRPSRDTSLKKAEILSNSAVPPLSSASQSGVTSSMGA